ncbi:MAG: GAF domain-containing protein [Paracoccaceae bacterium]
MIPPSETFKAAPKTSNEERRLEAVKKLGIIGTSQGDIFEIYSELAIEISGYFIATTSLIDLDTQHGLSFCSSTGEFEKQMGNEPPKNDRNQSICSYTILSSDPLIVPDCREHEIFKEAGPVKAGMVVSYAGFPIINKDNYVFGTLCLLDPNIKKLDSQQIKLIEKLTKRLAHQLDIQTEQRELTAEKMIDAISIFKTKIPNISIEDFNYFVNICAGREIDKANCENLINNGLCSFNDNSSIELSEKGRNLQLEMGLQTRVLNKRKLEGETANKMVDNMLSELENL